MLSDRSDQGYIEPHQIQHFGADRPFLSPGQPLSVGLRGLECVLEKTVNDFLKRDGKSLWDE